jgi:hypothetical protein
MLRIYGTTRLLRSWDLSPYQTIHNSLALLIVLNPFDHVVCWIKEANGKLRWDGDEKPGLDADGNLL